MYGTRVTSTRPFDEVLAAARTALADQGFGIVSEIDMAATLRAKLGVVTPRITILGACHPGFAHEALQAEPSIGLLLPCNVVVREAEEGTLVEAVDPRMMVDVTANEDLAPIAQDVGRGLRSALGTLGS